MSYEGIELIFAKIESWDCEDVRDLLNLLRSVKDEIINDTINSVLFDVGIDNEYAQQVFAECKWDYISNSLPIAEEYEERVMKIASGYPVWTCDKKGFCLVGECADSIQHIDTVEGWMNVE